MDLHVYHSNVYEETCEVLVVPGKDNRVERRKRVNTCNLDRKSYAEEEKVIVSVSVRLLRRFFLFLIEMEEKKESIAEEEAEPRNDDIKNFYHVHNIGDCGRDSIFQSKQRASHSTKEKYCFPQI